MIVRKSENSYFKETIIYLPWALARFLKRVGTKGIPAAAHGVY